MDTLILAILAVRVLYEICLNIHIISYTTALIHIVQNYDDVKTEAIKYGIARVIRNRAELITVRIDRQIVRCVCLCTVFIFELDWKYHKYCCVEESGDYTQSTSNGSLWLRVYKIENPSNWRHSAPSRKNILLLKTIIEVTVGGSNAKGLSRKRYLT